MLSQHIALVAEAEGVSLSDVARVSAALQTQVMRDLAPTWGVSASVDAFPRLEDVPAGYWPILITSADLGTEAGVRLDRDGQPYAQIELSSSWSLDASRACLEMLVNAFGSRTVSATSPRSDQGSVQVLIEVCAPCGDAQRAYTIHDVIVSDFCTPTYFDNSPGTESKPCSFNGSIQAPFRVLQGGHVTWLDLVSGSWWRRGHWGENPVDLRLGGLNRSTSSVRELASGSVPRRSRSTTPERLTFEARVELERQHALHLSKLRAERLRDLLRSGDAGRGVALEAHVAKPIALPLPAGVLHAADATRTADLIHEVDAMEIIAETPHASTNDHARHLPMPDAPSAPSKQPPPLPLRASAPSEQSPSLAPVTSMLDRDRRAAADGAPTRAWLAWGALAAAAAVVLMWNARDSRDGRDASIVSTPLSAAPAASAPPAPPMPATPLITTQEAATAPSEVPAAVAVSAPAVQPEVEAPKRSSRNAKRTQAALLASTPEPAPAPAAKDEPSKAAPVLVIAPSSEVDKPSAAPETRAALSIDDLIDTRQ